MKTVAVIIPALNEAGNIGQLVKEVRDTARVEVIVVDNNSSDATGEQARLAGAKVVFESRKGYGYACSAGVTETTQDVLVFMDGDHSFSSADLPLLIKPIVEGKADLVLGSRESGNIAQGAMPFHQRFGNWLVSRLMNMIYGLSISDLGPYRSITRNLLEELDMQEMTYGWPTEMIVKAAKQGARIIEVPVDYQKRRTGQSKVSGTIKGTFLAAWFILRIIFRFAKR